MTVRELEDILLPGSRRLALCEVGDPDGLVAFYYHGTRELPTGDGPICGRGRRAGRPAGRLGPIGGGPVTAGLSGGGSHVLALAAPALTACTAPSEPSSSGESGSTTVTNGADLCTHPPPVSLGRPGIPGKTSRSPQAAATWRSRPLASFTAPPSIPPRGHPLSLGDTSQPPSFDAARAVVANQKFQVTVPQ